MASVENPLTSFAEREASSVPPDQVMSLLAAKEISTTSLASTSSKETVAEASRSCLEASGAYVKPVAAAAVTVGASLTLATVMVNAWVVAAELESVASKTTW